MIVSTTNFPKLHSALSDIGFDNGMFHRDSKIMKEDGSLDISFMENQFTIAEFETAERGMETLTDDELTEFAIGEETEQGEIIQRSDALGLAFRILNAFFDGAP